MPRPRSDIPKRIVEAARRRFLREGLDGASLRSIADDAKTNLGMIVYYFPTKDDLFFAVVEELYGRLLDDFAKALAPGPPVRERLRHLFHRIGQLTPEELEVVQLIVREVLGSPTRIERLLIRFSRGHISLVMGLIGEGVRDGTFSRERHPLIALAATLALAGPAQVLARALPQRLAMKGSPSRDKMSDELLDVLMNGIADRQRSRGNRKEKP